jgi:dTDP-4-amino-4,6-dideoxygalactose transaminase
MIPLAMPNLTGREAEYLHQCIETGFVSSVGPFVTRFEGMVAEAAGSAHAVATSSGTTGLHAALVAVGVARDDLVILPSFTFIASANAIAHCCATPWLFDVASESWTLDPVLLCHRLAAETHRTGGRLIHKETGRRVAAMLPVYALGIPADMDAIVAVAREYNLPVVADGAAVLGATYKKRRPGTWGADLTVFSFNGNKTVTAGGGGAVVGADAALVQLVRHLTTTARVGEDYHHDRVGFNYRMTNLDAAVGCAQMERLTEFVDAKRRIQQTYNTALHGLPGIGTFPSPEWAEESCWLSGVTLPDADSAMAVRCRLKDAGIDGKPFWKPVHLQPAFVHSPATSQPVSTDIWSRIVTLPCSTGLTNVEQARVIDVVRQSIT